MNGRPPAVDTAWPDSAGKAQVGIISAAPAAGACPRGTREEK